MKLAAAACAFFLAIAVAGAAVAAAPVLTAHDTPLADPAQEARARALQKDLRCLVCQAQSVDDSNSEFAADVRTVVRDHIQRGESDRQIKDFLVARYGDFILMEPPVKPETFLLWFGPALLLAGGGVVLWLTIGRARKRAASEPAENLDSAI